MAESGGTEPQAESEEEIPKLPRAPLFGKPSLNSIVRIGMIATVLYAIIVMRKPCAEGVGRFIGGFDETPDADAGPASITDHYPGYELMTAEELLKRYPDMAAQDAGPGAPALDGTALDAGSLDTGSLDAAH